MSGDSAQGLRRLAADNRRMLGKLAVVALLIYEHSLVRPSDLSRLDMAFFNVNGYIAVIVLVAVVTGLWHR